MRCDSSFGCQHSRRTSPSRDHRNDQAGCSNAVEGVTGKAHCLEGIIKCHVLEMCFKMVCCDLFDLCVWIPVGSCLLVA